MSELDDKLQQLAKKFDAEARDFDKTIGIVDRLATSDWKQCVAFIEATHRNLAAEVRRLTVEACEKVVDGRIFDIQTAVLLKREIRALLSQVQAEEKNG